MGRPRAPALQAPAPPCAFFDRASPAPAAWRCWRHAPGFSVVEPAAAVHIEKTELGMRPSVSLAGGLEDSGRFSVVARQPAAAVLTNGPPRPQGCFRIARPVASTYPVSGSSPDQDGYPRVAGPQQRCANLRRSEPRRSTRSKPTSSIDRIPAVVSFARSRRAVTSPGRRRRRQRVHGFKVARLGLDVRSVMFRSCISLCSGFGFRAADGRIDSDRPRFAGEAWGAFRNPASISALGGLRHGWSCRLRARRPGPVRRCF